MRIISGIYKSRRILAPSKLPVRPTTDMAKEALFNILNNRYYFDEIAVLDLFSGTGNISYEFGSRGTTKLTAVDADFGCIQFIDKTAIELSLPITTIKSDAYLFLEKTNARFDIIFTDPPYDMSLEDFQRLPDLIFENKLLNKGGLLVIEHGKQTDLSSLPNFSEKRKYGSNVFSFFESV